MSQIHKKFNTDTIVGMLKKYLNKEIDREYIQEILGIKKRRFFSILKIIDVIQKNFQLNIKKISQNELILKLKNILLRSWH
jgi:hypothetical protein